MPAASTARARISAVRKIIRSGTATRIDGYLVDIQTAAMLNTVYGALSPANRARFGDVPLPRLVDVGWKAVR